MKIAFVTDSGTGKSVGSLRRLKSTAYLCRSAVTIKITRIWRSWALMKFMSDEGWKDASPPAFSWKN